MDKRYSDDQLARIREQAMIYQCACPGQVSASVAAMRELYEYQTSCMNATDTDRAVHARIAAAAILAHAELERCLSDVLAIEGWDIATLAMPAHMQKRRLDSFDNI